MKATVEESCTLLDFVVQMLKVTKKTKARQLLQHKGVTVDGSVVVKASLVLSPGQVVEIEQKEKRKGYALKAGKFAARIHHEDDAIIVAEKPVGLLTIATDKGEKDTMHGQLMGYMQSCEGGNIHTVHRLDRHVGGLMVFAKNSSAKADLQLAWEDAEKRYVAMVSGAPAEPKGRIETYLKEISPQKVVVTDENDPKGKLAITEYRTRETLEGHTLLDLKILTGRRHQIRVHLAHLGCPIFGDRTYNPSTTETTPDIMLFSYFLRFRHPKAGRAVKFEIPIPRWDVTKKKVVKPKSPKAKSTGFKRRKR